MSRGNILRIIIAALFILMSLWMTNAYFAPPDFAAYYTYTRSILHDIDLNFSNEYEHFAFEKQMLYVTQPGYLSNDWPMGAGLVWILFYIPGEILALVSGAPLDGFSPPFAAATLTGILFLVAFGLYSAYLFLEERFGSMPAFGCVILCFFGTPLLFYTFYGGLMSHATGFPFITLFLILWGTTLKKRERVHWILLGLLAGLITLIRPQHAATLIVFIVEIIYKIREKEFRLNKFAALDFIKGAALSAATFFLTLLPVFIYWGKIYGTPFQLPKMEEMHWLRPALYETLFSDYHGILPWTPVILPATLGLFFLLKKNSVFISGLLACLFIQIYINAANEVWWAGGSFSNRRITEYGFIFMVGLAGLFSDKRWKWWIAPTILMALWSFILVIAERSGTVTLAHYVPWNGAFFKSVFSTLFTRNWFISLKGNFGDISWGLRILCIVFLAFMMIVLYFLHEKKNII
jgi:hypothetical protein